MNKREYINLLVDFGLEKSEARAEIELILETVLNKTREELLLCDCLEDEKILPVVKKRIETGAPIQYILGFAPFMGENFIVSENVLIPRDETEILVRAAFEFANSDSSILDIGTGSGIIACGIGKLAKEKKINLRVLGVDVSTAALNVAIDNMKKLNLTGVCMFRKSDLFSSIRENEKFDIIVSNPPYIPKKMAKTIQKEVKFEPEGALFVDDEDGLTFYKKITARAPEFLTPKGVLLFEAMAGQAFEIEQIMKDNGFVEIEKIKDLQGIERVIKGKTP